MANHHHSNDNQQENGNNKGSQTSSMDKDSTEQAQNTLPELRKAIDHIDTMIIDLLSSRMAIAKDVALYKKANDREALDQQRENELINKLLRKAAEKKVNEEMILALYNIILGYSKKEQQKILEQ